MHMTFSTYYGDWIRKIHVLPIFYLNTPWLQILGLVGSARKRTLTLWQAVEFSRANDMAITSTLQVASKCIPSITKIVDFENHFCSLDCTCVCDC